MALVKSGSFGSSPSCSYEIHGEQLSGSGTKRKVKITVNLKVEGSSSQSRYGYPINWKARINSSYSEWMKVKGTETWYATQGFRSYSWTQEVDVGTASSKGITVGFQTDMTTGSSSWETTQTGTYTVGQTNTAPYFNSSNNWIKAKISSGGSELSSIYPENISTVYAEWGQALDNEGGTIRYSTDLKINSGGWNNVYSGTSRGSNVKVNTGEGDTFQLRTIASDSSGVKSSYIYSKTYTMNRFTPATLSSNSSISYNTTSISLTRNNGHNSSGDTNFTYRLTCDGITVYNASNIGASTTLTIHKSGTTPAGAYINFTDLKNKLTNSNYSANLTFRLHTKNHVSSEKGSLKNISANIKTSPSTTPNLLISKDNKLSTAYRYVSFSKNNYFLPDGSKTIYVQWNNATCHLGTSVIYDVYYQLENESWQLVASRISTNYFKHTAPKYNTSKRFRYIIRATTSFGDYTDTYTGYETLHYYNSPTLSQGTITRGATTTDVNVTIKSNSSIPNIATTGSWVCNYKGTNNKISSGNLTQTQSNQVIKLTNLTDEAQYDLIITFNDNTGLNTSSLSGKVNIGANAPIFFVNKYGVGVGGVKADNSYGLKLKGNMDIKGNLKTDGNFIVNGIAVNYQTLGANVNLNDITTTGHYSQNGNVNTSLALNYPVALAGHLTVTTGAGIQQKYHVYNSSKIYVRAKYSTEPWTTWTMMYNQVYKPTPSELGAVSKSGDTMTNNLVVEHSSSNCLITAKRGADRCIMTPSSTEGEFLFGGNRKASHDPPDRYIRIGHNKLQYTYNGSTTHNIYHEGRKPTPSEIGAASPIQIGTLWKGGYAMNGKQTITPSKPLSNCQTGWILLWSDYDANTGKVNNHDFAYTIIRKETIHTVGGYGMTNCFAGGSSNKAAMISKYLNVSNTRITGHDENGVGNGQDAVLVAVYEF